MNIVKYEKEMNYETLEDVVELAKENRHAIWSVIEQLKKNENEKIVVWGTYTNGIKVKHFLEKEYGISVDACIVNKKYLDLSINQAHYEDFLLYPMEEYLKENVNVNIIIDFSFFNDEMLSEYVDAVHNVYVLDMMGIFIYDEHPPICMTYEYLMEHYQDIKEVFSWLIDKQSKTEYLDFIAQRVLGYYSKEYHSNQYFDRDIISYENEEVYVDCGAFDGDTVRSFIHSLDGRQYKKIYAVEMDQNNYKLLKKNCVENDKIECINSGVGKTKTVLKANMGNCSTSYVSEYGEYDICIDAIDNMVKDKVTFIKMDIEGYELDALMGAEKTISSDKPRLAICLYHKLEDIYAIPKYIKQLVPEYSLYFRNYHNSSCESVIYAIMKKC